MLRKYSKSLENLESPWKILGLENITNICKKSNDNFTNFEKIFKNFDFLLPLEKLGIFFAILKNCTSEKSQKL